MKYLIFLDIDGTILPPWGTSVPPRTVAGIRRAQAEGHKVFINSGRAIGIIPKDLLDTVKPDGIVAGLGVWIRADGKQMLAETVPTEDVLFAMHYGREIGNTVILEAENGCIGIGPRPWAVVEHRVRTPEEYPVRFPDLRVSKMTFSEPLRPEEVRVLAERFSVFSHPTYAEVGVKGYSKATGMELLRKYYGADHAHVVAMGDSDNDSEMLRAAGISVAMGNAVDGIRDIADFVTLDCRDGGVGYAIEQLVLGKE